MLISPTVLQPVNGGASLGTGERNGNPLQYSCLENSMDKGAWWAPVHGVAKSQTRLSNYTHTHKSSVTHNDEK